MRTRRTTVASLVATAALAAAYGLGTVSGVAPAVAQTAPATATADGVAVTGVGTVQATPDVLQMSLRVVVVRPDVSSALAAANVVTANIRGTLRGNGVAAADLQTTELQVAPSRAGKPSRVVGYQVVQGLGVRLRDLGRAGAVITKTITTGGPAIRFDGVFFSLSDDSPVKVKARDKAFADARAKAEQYARLSGRTLGAVRSVEEDLMPYYGQPERAFASAAGDSAARLSLDPGTQRVDVRVVVRWTLA